MLQIFPYYAPIMLHCAQLCSIMLHKLLLPESEDYSLSLTTPMAKQLKALNFTISTQISTVHNIRQLFLMELS